MAIEINERLGRLFRFVGKRLDLSVYLSVDWLHTLDGVNVKRFDSSWGMRSRMEKEVHASKVTCSVLLSFVRFPIKGYCSFLFTSQYFGYTLCQ